MTVTPLPRAASIAAHPAGKAWRIAEMDAAEFERKAEEHRELALQCRDLSRLQSYHRAIAAQYEHLADTAHSYADLLQQGAEQ